MYSIWKIWALLLRAKKRHIKLHVCLSARRNLAQKQCIVIIIWVNELEYLISTPFGVSAEPELRHTNNMFENADSGTQDLICNKTMKPILWTWGAGLIKSWQTGRTLQLNHL